MDKILLIQFCDQGFSSYEIARAVGKSPTTVRYWLKKFKLKSKSGAKYQSSFVCKCGETDKNNFTNCGNGRVSKSICKKCHNTNSISRFRDNKRQFVDYKGGKCQKCTYHKYLGALEFHHVNPKEKDPNWTRLKSFNLENAKKELDKCILLCSNCHKELHGKIFEL